MTNIVLAQNKYGQKIWIDKSGHIGDAILRKGIYDAPAIYYIEKILQQIKKPICLDIGAHIGNHALVMAKFSEHVYCFDPEAENIDFLNKNKQENNLSNMEIFNVGLSDKNETLTFYKNGIGGCSTFTTDLRGENYSEQNLHCRVGDEVLREHGITKVDFIKIDIEGFEARALYGLSNTIRSSKPIIMMEWNNKVTKLEFEKYDLFNTLFADYQFLSILHNHHSSYWGNHWSQQLLRFFYRKVVSKKKLLASFNPDVNYANILLYPNQNFWIANLEKFRTPISSSK